MTYGLSQLTPHGPESLMNLDHQKEKAYPLLRNQITEDLVEEKEFGNELNNACEEIRSELEGAVRVFRKLSETC